MKKPLNNIIASLLMLCTSFSIILYVFFGIEQFSEKHEASRNITEKKGLCTLNVSVRDFDRQPDKNEIWYEGELYDIGNYIVSGDTASIEVFHDKQEESLVKRITDCFEQENKYSPDNNTHLIKHRIHIPDDFKILVKTNNIRELLTKEIVSMLPKINVDISSLNFSKVLTPPPNIA